jgi:hypothetical protein
MAGGLVKGEEPDKLVKRHQEKQELDRVRDRMRESPDFKIPKIPKLEPVPGTGDVVWRKRASAAASLGRRAAHSTVNQELAKMAGAILANQVGSDQEFEKVATLMVRTGALTEEQFFLEKEAGWSGLRSLFSKARGALTGARGKIGNWFAKRRGAPSFDRGKAARGWSSGSGSVPEALGGKPKVKAPAASAPAPSGGAPDPNYGMSKKHTSAPSGGAPGGQKKPWKFPMGKALLYGGAAGTIYAGSKLVPAAARAIESTSTTPMAHGMGWSPVSYGYGYNPYGSGMATMGGGA